MCNRVPVFILERSPKILYLFGFSTYFTVLANTVHEAGVLTLHIGVLYVR